LAPFIWLIGSTLSSILFVWLVFVIQGQACFLYRENPDMKSGRRPTAVNPKHESRNPKQIQITKIENKKRCELKSPAVNTGLFNIK
jgi:hypothetical protein